MANGSFSFAVSIYLLVIVTINNCHQAEAGDINGKVAVGYALTASSDPITMVQMPTGAMCLNECNSTSGCGSVNYHKPSTNCTLLSEDYSSAGVNLICDIDYIHYAIDGTKMPSYIPSPLMACTLMGDSCPKVYQSCTAQCVSNRWAASCTSPSYTSCIDAYNKGARRDGPYLVKPDSDAAFEVYCRMSPDSDTGATGGYAVILRRTDGSMTFTGKTFANMQNSQGDINTNEWFIGLSNLNRYTNAGRSELLIVAYPFEPDYSVVGWLKYAGITVGNVSNNFGIMSLGSVAGSYLGDELTNAANGRNFATTDKDPLARNCPNSYQQIPNWYNTCPPGMQPFGRYFYGWYTGSYVGTATGSFMGWSYSYKRMEWRIK